MNNVVIVGAGKEGKGTFGDIFYENGWNISFLDNDLQVISKLNKKKEYFVTALYEDHSEEHIIKEFNAYLIQNHQDYASVIERADVIMLALYPEDIDEAAKNLTVNLKKRFIHNPNQNLTIIAGTNKNHFITHIEHSFISQLTDEEEKWFQGKIALRDMIVRRSSNSENTYDLHLTTKVVQTLLIQSPVYFNVEEFQWFELHEHLEMMKDIKIYTYNCPHVTCAFAGYLKGYKTIEEAQKDPNIKLLMDHCLSEAKKGILKEYPITEQELDDFVNAPKPLGEEEELISRVALDPIRKLSLNDRLTGNAVICLKHGIYPQYIIQSIANGMAYDEKNDKKAQYIQNLIIEKGISYAISQVIGLPENSIIVKGVIEAYNQIK